MPPKAGTITRTTKRAMRPITADYVAALSAYAEILFKGGFAPRDVTRPEGVAALIEVGRDVGLPATQAVAWIMILNGRPSIWGDAALALILASGLLEEREEWYEGTPGQDNYTACFKLKRVGAKEPRVARFSVADAKRANLWGGKLAKDGKTRHGPWKEYPERQLMWRAKSWACRDEFPDVLCGLSFYEELRDIEAAETGRVTVSQVETPPAAIAAPAPVAAPTATAPEATEITEDQIDRLTELRALVCAAKGANNDDDRRTTWLATIKPLIEPYGATSAMDLNSQQAAELIEQLGKMHDPFTHPPAVSSTPAT